MILPKTPLTARAIGDWMRYLDRFMWPPFGEAELDLRVWARLQRR